MHYSCISKYRLYVSKFLDMSPRMLTWVFTSTFWSWLRPHKISIPGCAPHQLLGDASHIDASASQAASLNKSHLRRGILTKWGRIACIVSSLYRQILTKGNIPLNCFHFCCAPPWLQTLQLYARLQSLLILPLPPVQWQCCTRILIIRVVKDLEIDNEVRLYHLPNISQKVSKKASL